MYCWELEKAGKCSVQLGLGTAELLLEICSVLLQNSTLIHTRSERLGLGFHHKYL